MRGPKSCFRVSCLAVVAVAAACTPPDDSLGSRFADDRATSPAIAPAAAPRIAGDESMAALTAEVRQLRIAVEELARNQIETQALGMTLSAQQDRILQVAQQLDAARKEIASASSGRQGFERQVAGLSAELSGSTDREQRAGLESAIRAIEAEQSRLELELQQARGRESDLSRQLAREEDGWNDLLSRLERLTQ